MSLRPLAWFPRMAGRNPLVETPHPDATANPVLAAGPRSSLSAGWRNVVKVIVSTHQAQVAIGAAEVAVVLTWTVPETLRTVTASRMRYQDDPARDVHGEKR